MQALPDQEEHVFIVCHEAIQKCVTLCNLAIKNNAEETFMWGLQFWNILVQAAVDVNSDVLHDNGLKLLENLLKENVGVVSELKSEKKYKPRNSTVYITEQ